MEQTKFIQLYVNRLALIKYLLMVLLLSSLSTTVFSADTEIDIQANSENLRQEYRQELDKWMLRAYEGDPDAQFKVGVLFSNQQFDSADHEQAVYWYTQAARQGHVLAQYNLGHQYLTGVGVRRNEKNAMEWWLKAAAQDHALAQFNIGRAFYLGIGVKEDHAESKKWFNRAARNQEPKSIEILEQLGWNDEAAADSQVATEVPEPISQPNASSTNIFQREDAHAEKLVSKVVPANIEPAPLVIEPSQPVLEASPSVVEPSPTKKEVSTPVVEVVIDSKPANSNEVTITTETEVAIDTPALPSPVTLYTNPRLRSVLISIVDDRNTLNVIERGDEWYTVNSKIGFPVWVHSDYVENIDSKSGRGSITGNAVNARSVPIVTYGTVVGRLNKNEQITILEQSKAWYRVVAPLRFKAWVRVDDYERHTMVADTSAAGTAWKVASPVQRETKADRRAAKTTVKPSPKATASSNQLNDNQWLYKQPTENYTLQLASFDDQQKVANFISRHFQKEDPKLHRFSSKGKNIEWTYFLYGSYASKNSAEAAKSKLGQKRAWVRTISTLQQNRCLAWKKQLPPPPELNKYCGA